MKNEGDMSMAHTKVLGLIGLAICASGTFACSQPVSDKAMLSQSAPDQDIRHPVSGLRVVPLRIQSGQKQFNFKVEIAQTEREQAKGLMFRTALGPNEGMVFPRNPRDVPSFWMKNTPLPLDIIFVGPNGKILNIAAQTPPYSLDPVSAVGMTAFVLELPGGRAEELGIEAGDSVAY